MLLVAALALGAAFSRASQAGARAPGSGHGSGQNGGNQNSGTGNQGSDSSTGDAANTGAQNGGNQNNSNQNDNQNQNGPNQVGGDQNATPPSGDQYVPLPEVTYTSMTILELGRAAVRASTNSVVDAPERATAPPKPDPELTLADARDDFSTIAESYVLKNVRDGAWPYKDARGRRRGLALVKVETESVARASRRRYAGLVRLRDVADGKELKLLFTVDLSGDDWRVVSVAEPRAAKKSDVR